MADVEPREQIRLWLVEQGYTYQDIEKIMRRVGQYDVHTLRDSLFDSIGGGEIAVQDIIKQALDDVE